MNYDFNNLTRNNPNLQNKAWRSANKEQYANNMNANEQLVNGEYVDMNIK